MVTVLQCSVHGRREAFKLKAILSQEYVDQETIACPQLTYLNKLHATLICIVKHFGNCDGERHGVTIISLPSLKTVKTSPDSY